MDPGLQEMLGSAKNFVPRCVMPCTLFSNLLSQAVLLADLRNHLPSGELVELTQSLERSVSRPASQYLCIQDKTREFKRPPPLFIVRPLGAREIQNNMACAGGRPMLVAAVAAIAATTGRAAPTAPAPHIVFLMADDLGTPLVCVHEALKPGLGAGCRRPGRAGGLVPRGPRAAHWPVHPGLCVSVRRLQRRWVLGSNGQVTDDRQAGQQRRQAQHRVRCLCHLLPLLPYPSSERGVAVSMPKSMLTVTSHADAGRCKRKRDARGSSGAMGCHGCRETRTTRGQRRFPPGLPNLAPQPKRGVPKRQRLVLQDGGI